MSDGSLDETELRYFVVGFPNARSIAQATVPL